MDLSFQVTISASICKVLILESNTCHTTLYNTLLRSESISKEHSVTFRQRMLLSFDTKLRMEDNPQTHDVVFVFQAWFYEEMLESKAMSKQTVYLNKVFEAPIREH